MGLQLLQHFLISIFRKYSLCRMFFNDSKYRELCNITLILKELNKLDIDVKLLS